MCTYYIVKDFIFKSLPVPNTTLDRSTANSSSKLSHIEVENTSTVRNIGKIPRKKT